MLFMIWKKTQPYQVKRCVSTKNNFRLGSYFVLFISPLNKLSNNRKGMVLQMKFVDMPYKRPDFNQICENLSDITRKFQQATSAEEQLALLKAVEDISIEYGTMASIGYVRNTINTLDAFYEEERKICDKNQPTISEKYQEFSKAVVNSKFRPQLEEKYGKIYFVNIEMELKSFSPEIIPLVQEENALKAQYQKLYASAKIDFDGKVLNVAQLGPYKQSQDRAVRKAATIAEATFFDENRAQFDEIFDKLVKNRTQQAKKLGFDNFVELGYLRQMRNCYSAEDVAVFRKEVVKHIVPLTEEIKRKQAERIGVSDFKFYDNTFRFKDGNADPQGTPDELLAAGLKMYTEMSPETADFIKLMFDMDLFDVLAKEGKAPGGYCTSFPAYHCPFIFSNFNGTAGDVDVLTHEAGHAFASYIADKEIEILDLHSNSKEVAETHSMSMEFLTQPWHELFFKDKTQKYELSHAEDALLFIPYGCMVDHFQEIIYSNPDLTPEQRNEKWAELEKMYRPYIDFADVPFYNRGAGWQRQLHVYIYPFYYIDYCLAQTMALQFWVAAMNNRDEAWQRYLKFVKQGGTKTFVELVESVDMMSPLKEGTLPIISGKIQNWLDEQYKVVC